MRARAPPASRALTLVALPVMASLSRPPLTAAAPHPRRRSCRRDRRQYDEGRGPTRPLSRTLETGQQGRKTSSSVRVPQLASCSSVQQRPPPPVRAPTLRDDCDKNLGWRLEQRARSSSRSLEEPVGQLLPKTVGPSAWPLGRKYKQPPISKQYASQSRAQSLPGCCPSNCKPLHVRPGSRFYSERRMRRPHVQGRAASLLAMLRQCALLTPSPKCESPPPAARRVLTATATPVCALDLSSRSPRSARKLFLFSEASKTTLKGILSEARHAALPDQVDPLNWLRETRRKYWSTSPMRFRRRKVPLPSG